MKLSHLLHRRLAMKEICIAPGVHDLVTAKMAERAGFPLMVATYAPITEWMNQQDWSRSLDISAAWRLTFIDQVRLICQTVTIPVLLDGEALCDTPRALQECTRQLEPRGLAGIIVGHGDEETQEQSLRALIAARHDSAFSIIVSTKLGAPATLTDTVQLIKAYRSAGADVVLLRGSGSTDELQTLPQQVVDLPLMIQISDAGHLPVLSAYELQNFGYSIAYWQTLAMSASTQAVWEALRELKMLGKGRRPCSDKTNCS